MRRAPPVGFRTNTNNECFPSMFVIVLTVVQYVLEPAESSQKQQQPSVFLPLSQQLLQNKEQKKNI